MKILLICSGGMSTSILVAALEKEAKKKKIQDFIATAIGAHEIDQYIQDYEYILIAPQIKHKFKTFEEIAKSNSKKVYQIQPMEYTPIGAPKLLESILKL